MKTDHNSVKKGITETEKRGREREGEIQRSQLTSKFVVVVAAVVSYKLVCRIGNGWT